MTLIPSSSRTPVRPIRTFLFDLGNVLVRFSHPRMYEQMARVLGSSPTLVEQSLAADRLQWRYEAGSVSTDELFEHLTGLAGRSVDRARLLHAVCDIFEPIAAMTTLTRRLKERGFRLVVVSNTNEAHIDFLRKRYDLLGVFDELVLSYAVKAMKPDVAFYEAALAAAQCGKGEALFTDDLAENVAGAGRFGFQTLLFTTPTAFAADLRGLGVDPD